MLRRLLLVLVAIALIVAACTSSANKEAAGPPPTPTPAVATPDVDPTTAPVATATPIPSGVPSQLPDAEAAMAVAAKPAPLGTFVVAKRKAGIARAPTPGTTSRREIPVYDQPFGPPRSLLDVNAVDGFNRPINLVNWDDPDGVLVMRVIAGGPDDDWIVVQAPVRPLDSYVWVRTSDFDFGFTSKRIEIDLADEGRLRVLDGDAVLLESKIVQGRESRTTPTHLTYLQRGTLGERVSPAYGELILSIASFSEVLGTFGGGGLPSNFIHGTNQPELMGQRVSSGSIRLPNDALLRLADLTLPGTPVMLFDSSGERSTRDGILSRPLLPAATTRFLEGADGAGDGTTGLIPELWRRCELGGSRPETDSVDPVATVEAIEGDVGVPLELPDIEQLVCRNDATPEFVVAGGGNEHVFAVAKPDAGELYLLPALGESLPEEPGDFPRRMIPVFDEPNGEPRALVYRNEIDGSALDYPLYAETVFGEPTVVSVIKMTTDAQWLLVRAPVLPNNTAVWVRGEDFELDSTTLRVEVDIGYEFLGRVGMLSVWDGDVSLMAAKISSGRDTRPTVATATYIDQIIEGGSLSPAYGPWIFSTPSYSETLGTFGGGGMPQQAIHGIGPDLDEIMGTPSSSGSIHVTYDAIEEMAAIDDLLGAAVYFYDSSNPAMTESVVRRAPVAMAETIPIQNLSTRDTPIGSFT